MPYLAIAASVSPPPAIENAFDSAIARAIRAVPAPNWSNSNTPTGPFQTIVPALCDDAGEQLGGLRSDVENHVVGADLRRPASTLARARADNSPGHDHVDRQRHLRAARFHVVDDRVRFADQVGLRERFADRAGPPPA